jgi:Domain of unknown function (DUF4145)
MPHRSRLKRFSRAWQSICTAEMADERKKVPGDVLRIAKAIQAEVPRRGRPPEEPERADSEQVLPHSLVRNTRGYIERVVTQINGAYEHGWFDACAVMIRRLVETLIIETFEAHLLSNKVQNPAGDFLYLRDLISATLAEATWNLGRNTKQALGRLKDVGDRSAHSRRFNAQRNDIEKLIPDLRDVVQELVYLARLK